MKYIYLFFFLYLSHSLTAQNSDLNFEEIKTNVQNAESRFFYEKMVYRFQFDPMLLDSVQMKHLYYGKNFTKYKIDPLSLDKLDFIHDIRSADTAKSIRQGNNLLSKDPTDLEVLALMLQIYSRESDPESDYGYRATQLKRLLETIVKNKTSDEKNQNFTVMSVGDEYVLAGFLQINLQSYRRSSINGKNATTDIWKKGKKRINFRVMYDSLD